MSVTTGARTGFEQFILDRQKQLSAGNKHYVISPEEYNKAAVEYFGKIEDTLPEGAKVTRTVSPLEVEYELNGKTYKAFRNTDSNLGINTGKVQTTQLGSLIDSQSGAGEQDLLKQLLPGLFGQVANGNTGTIPTVGEGGAITKGAVTNGNSTVNPNAQGGQNWLDKLMGNADALAGSKGFVALDPDTQSLLDAIKGNSDQQLKQQFGDQSDSLVASLYGKGINKSNIAGTQANRLLQGQGLVQAQSNSDAAQRTLQALQFLTQNKQGNLALAGEEYTSGAQQSEQGRNNNLSFATNLLNQALQREVSGTQLNQSQQSIDNQQSQFEQNYGLQRDQFEAQAAQQRRANRIDMIKSILTGIVSIGAAPFTGGASLAGLGSLLGGKPGNGGAPPAGGDGGYG